MLPLRYLSIRLTSLCRVDWWGGLGGCRFISPKGFAPDPQAILWLSVGFQHSERQLEAGRTEQRCPGGQFAFSLASLVLLGLGTAGEHLPDGGGAEPRLGGTAAGRAMGWVLGVAGRGVLGAVLTSRVPVPTGAVEQRPHGHRRYLVSPSESLWKKTFL